MEIKRDSYLEQVKSYAWDSQVKVITGIRRCGKSYLLFRLFKRFLLEQGVPPDHIIEIEFDRRRSAHLRNPDAACAYIDSRLGDDVAGQELRVASRHIDVKVVDMQIVVQDGFEVLK